ncbi:hypothetical protein [[Phormidium] sp. ETS-05]|nr:hypothetical protein [[Phormidium] sp. ETS-05]
MAEMVSPPPPTLSPNLRQCDRRFEDAIRALDQDESLKKQDKKNG